MNSNETTAIEIKASKLQWAHMTASKALGQEHEAVKLLWEEYLKANAEAHPIRIARGQRMMQKQIDNMTEEEAETFNSIHY